MAEFDWPQSEAKYEVAVLRDVAVPMRDGVVLRADVYRPMRDGELAGESAGGPFPAILIRTPYDKNAALAGNGPEFWARRGYVQVVQDVRGRFNSGGDFYLLRDEGPDGYDTIEWVADQPWCDGQVGTMGTSYLAWVQSAAACLNPPHLSAMWVNQGAFNGLTSSLRHGGALELRWLSWAFWGGSLSKEARADPLVATTLERGATAFRDWLRRLPWREGETPLASAPNYERWALDLMQQGLSTDPLWQSTGMNFERHAEAHADVPTMYSSGWYDSYTRETTSAYTYFSRHKTSKQHLMMGPWTHGDAALSRSYSGDLEFGPTAAVDGNLAESVPHLLLRFFDHYLKGMANGVAEEAPVRTFVMGGGSGRRLPESMGGRLEHGGAWREEADWPLERARTTAFFLNGDGTLGLEAPTGREEPSRFDFDPERPVPTISANISSLNDLAPQPEGLALPLEPGARRRNVVAQGGSDQRERPDVFMAEPPYLPLASRPDVLAFASAPLEADTEVTGPIRVSLWVSTSAVDTDFTAKLVDVYPPSVDYPEGYALGISDSIKRLRFRNGYEREEFATPGEVVPVSIELYPTSNVFAAGHRIRLDISSSNFPRFDVNPNTGEPLGRQTRTVVAHQSVFHDGERPSCIDLPVVGGRWLS